MSAPEEVKVALLAEREQLQGRLDEVHAGPDASLSFDEGFADTAQVSAEQGENRALANTLEGQLADIDKALASIDAGTYGTCATCGAPIGDDRLAAMPATVSCIEHA